MMILFLIWLADFIGKVHVIINVFLLLAIILCIVGGITFCANSSEYDKAEIKWHNWGKTKVYLAIKVAIASAIIGAIIPSKNTYYAMVGVYVGQEIIANPTSQRLFDKSIQAIELKLDEVINSDLKKDK